MTKRQRKELRKLSQEVQPIATQPAAMEPINFPRCASGRASDYEWDGVEIPLPKFSSAALFAEAERQSRVSPLATAAEELAAEV